MTYLDKLQRILAVTDWSQEELSRRVQVSFPALNAWLNERAKPRKSSMERIDHLYLSIVGVESVDPEELRTKVTSALEKKLRAKELITDSSIREKLTLHLTYHTNTIEGSTMTMSDVEEVLFQHKVLSNRTAIEQAEARNHQAVLYWLLDEIIKKDFNITEELILAIHLRLMNGIVSDAGQYRKHTVRIMGSRVALANWQKIPDLIAQYVSKLHSETDDIVTTIAKSHAQFEKIHPFSDGNGRTGRLLILAQALHAGFVPPIIIRERKQAYYKYLEQAQSNEQYDALTLFVAESILASDKLLFD